MGITVGAGLLYGRFPRAGRCCAPWVDEDAAKLHGTEPVVMVRES